MPVLRLASPIALSLAALVVVLSSTACSTRGASTGTGALAPRLDAGATQVPIVDAATPWFACDGDHAAYDVVVQRMNDAWQARGGAGLPTQHGTLEAAMRDGFDRMTPGRTSKQRMLVQGNGTVNAAHAGSRATPSSTSAGRST